MNAGAFVSTSALRKKLLLFNANMAELFSARLEANGSIAKKAPKPSTTWALSFERMRRGCIRVTLSLPALVNTCLFISLIARALRGVVRVYDTSGCVCLARAARVARVSIARVECLQLIIHKKIFSFSCQNGLTFSLLCDRIIP